MSAKLFLILESGNKMEIRTTDTVGLLLYRLKREDVDTIVAGKVEDGKVLWEKQFNACTVMPTEFGKLRKN